MMPDALEGLRRVNEHIRCVLIRLRPEQTHCSAIRPQDFFDLLRQLVQASQYLQPGARAFIANLAWEKESLEYRRNLARLKNFLPDLQVRLLTEKARLESAQSKLAAATLWAEARKKTL